MEMTVTFGAASVKVLVEARQVAFRLSNLAMVRRTTALLELGERRRVPEVAARLGVSVATLYRRLHAFILHGLDSLRPRRSPGRPPKLTPSQRARLYELVVAGPLAAGYPSGCWSCLLLQDLIRREFGRTYAHRYIATLLRNLGLSYQKARFVSDHLDPERRRVWREETWPAILAEGPGTIRGHGACPLCRRRSQAGGRATARCPHHCTPSGVRRPTRAGCRATQLRLGNGHREMCTPSRCE